MENSKIFQALEMLRKASELASLPKQDHVVLEQAYQTVRAFLEPQNKPVSCPKNEGGSENG